MKSKSMKNRASHFFLVSVLVSISLIYIPLAGAKRKPIGNLTLGISTTGASLLLYTAKTEGFFKAHGLDVAVKEYEIGARNIEALIRGEVNFAMNAEFLFATHSLKMDDIRILGSIASVDISEVLARKDHGILEPRDIKDKDVAIVEGSIVEFFLSSFLQRQGMSTKDVRLIDMSAKAMVEPFRAGRISVVAALHPYTSLMKEDMGDRVVSWPIQGGRNYYSVITAREEYLNRNPEIAERFVAALVDAEQYVQTHEEEAKALLGERLGLTSGQVLEVWERNLYRIRLDQDLLLLLEDEVKWLFQKHGIKDQSIPNYLNYLYLDALEKVKPQAVRIVK